ncbi:BTB/POZ domain, partial [Trinorchestia longiramus]
MANTMLNEGTSSLVWPEHGRLVKERLQELYNSGQLVDVVLAVGHYQISAHQAVLAAASPVLLAHLLRCTGPHVQLQLDSLTEGCTSQDMHALLDFIYCGEACVPQYRLSAFLNIARQLQLVGFQETSIHSSTNNTLRNCSNVISQRTIPAPRPSLLVRTLSDQPSLATAEFQNLIPQFPLPMPPTFIPEASQPIPATPQIPSQLLECDLMNQEDFYFNSNLLSDNSGSPLHTSKYRQVHRDEPVKFGEPIKVDHLNRRNYSGSLSNTTFSDLCAADPDLSMLFLGDGRSLNPSLRPIFNDSSDASLATQDPAFPKDYSQSTLKLAPNSCNTQPNMSSSEIIVDQQQGLAPPISSAVVANVCSSAVALTHQPSESLPSHSQQENNQPFSVTGNGGACSIALYGNEGSLGLQEPIMNPDVQPLHLYHHHHYQQQPQLQSDQQHVLPPVAAAAVEGDMASSCTLTSLSATSVGSYETHEGNTNAQNLGYNTSNNIWPFLGACVESASESTQEEQSLQQQHKWCMPDETSLPELRNCSHPNESPSWGGGGRLKVKSSIGGVSLQDLSRASVSEGSLENMCPAGKDLSSTTTTSENNSAVTSAVTGTKSMSESHDVITPTENNKTSRGKLIVRTDIETSSFHSNTNIATSSSSAQMEGQRFMGKTASIRVVSGDELLEARHLRQDPTPPSVSVYNKVSVVPEQQLMEASCCPLTGPPPITLQEMAYGEEGRQPPGGDDIIKIKLPKPPIPVEQLDLLRDASKDSRSHVDASTAISNFLSIPSLPEHDLMEEETSEHAPSEALSGNTESMTVDDSEEVLVLRENSSDYQLPNNTSLDSLDVQVIGQTDPYHIDDETPEDIPQNLQVIFTSSHQPNLYPLHYSYCAPLENESLVEPMREGNSETTPIKDTAETQWATLHRKQNIRDEGTESNDYILESSQGVETSELKVKKCLFTSRPASRSQSPIHDEDTIDVIDSTGVGTHDPVFVAVSPSTVSIPPSPVLPTSSPAVSTSEDAAPTFTSGVSTRMVEFPSGTFACPVIQIDEAELPACHEYSKSHYEPGIESLNLKPRPISEPICLSVGTPSSLKPLSRTPPAPAPDFPCQGVEGNIPTSTRTEPFIELQSNTISLTSPEEYMEVGDVTQKDSTLQVMTTNSESLREEKASSSVAVVHAPFVPCPKFLPVTETNQSTLEIKSAVVAASRHPAYSNSEDAQRISTSTVISSESCSKRTQDLIQKQTTDLGTNSRTVHIEGAVDLAGSDQRESSSTPLLSVDNSVTDTAPSVPYLEKAHTPRRPLTDDKSITVLSNHSTGNGNSCDTEKVTEVSSQETAAVATKEEDTNTATSVGALEWKCTACPSVLHNEREVLQHAKQHFSSEWSCCCFCQKQLKNKSTLRVHVISHVVATHSTNAKAHKCNKCGAVYSQRNNLVRHMASRHQLSSSGAPLTSLLSCPHCSFACLALHKFKAHERSHNLEGAHKCPHCPYQSSVRNALVKHVRIHTKERPYVCGTCGFNAVTASILSRHKRSHSGIKPHSCPKCDRQFADSKRLRDHLLMHDNLKPFMCHVCGFACRRKDNLQTHIRNVHGEKSTSNKGTDVKKSKSVSSRKSKNGTLLANRKLLPH